MKTDRKRKDFQAKLQDFKRKNNKKIFDIAAFKCVDFLLCSCEKNRKVPIEECSFVIDQRSSRKTFIQSIRHETTKKFQKRSAREEQEKHRLEVYINDVRPSTSTAECADNSDKSSFDTSDNGETSNECGYKMKDNDPNRINSELSYDL